MPYDIPFVVNSDGYSATPMPGNVITTDLPGGFPRTERDFVNTYFVFNISFELTAKQYDELKVIYDSYLKKPEPVRLNLISMQKPVLHWCWITPGSWKLVKTQHDYFKVALKLIGAQA